MTLNIQAIRTYFAKLDLSPEVADLYVALYQYGPLSISELSRRSGIERTRIYRLLDTLKSSTLIEVEVKYKQNVFRAAPISNLHTLIAQKEQEVKELHDQLGVLAEQFSGSQASSPVTKVQYYQGPEGIKQMYWNELQGKTENLSILYENTQIRTNITFFERWARRCNERGIIFRSIVGDNFLASQKEWYAGHQNERLEKWCGRYVSDKQFPITCSMITYDNVTAYYNWKDGEIFGVEIYNQQIADTQRQFFEMLWSQGSRLEDKSR